MIKCALFKHRCLQIIKKIYKHAGKCDGQQQFIFIFDSSMVYTHERFTKKSPRSPMAPIPFNKPSAKKSLYVFTNMLDVKKKTDIH